MSHLIRRHSVVRKKKAHIHIPVVFNRSDNSLKMQMTLLMPLPSKNHSLFIDIFFSTSYSSQDDPHQYISDIKRLIIFK